MASHSIVLHRYKNYARDLIMQFVLGLGIASLFYESLKSFENEIDMTNNLG